jgi:hypothetical protein
LRRFCGELDRIHNELVRRFKGLFEQVLERLSHDQASSGFSASQKAEFFAGLEFRIRGDMRLLDDPRRFVPRLWEAIVAQLTAQGGDPLRIQALQPRFMLRQFVDEIRNRRARTLLESAYEPKYDQEPDADELIALRRAYPYLHRVLRSNAGELGLMTAESLSVTGVTAVHYERWLYPP